MEHKILSYFQAGDASGIQGLFKQYLDEVNFPIYNVDKNSYILRQRLLEDQHVYNREDELSYPPAELVKTYGRANIPYHPMFYASLFSSSNPICSSRLTILTESSRLLKHAEDIGVEFSVVSLWSLNSLLRFVYLPLSISHFPKANDQIMKFLKKWQSMYIKNQISEEVMNFLTTLAQVFSSPDLNYSHFVIGNLVYYLCYIHPEHNRVDGFIYPSVQSEGITNNLAIKPLSVQSSLSLKLASVCASFKLEAEELIVYTLNHGILEEDVINYKLTDQDWNNVHKLSEISNQYKLPIYNFLPD